MKVSDFLKKDFILSELISQSKEDVLKELSGFLESKDAIRNKEGLLKALLEREALGSTGIGENVAIPHAKSDQIKNITALFARSKEGINFDSLDQKPVHYVCLLIAPSNSTGLHLKALARIAKLLKINDLRTKILTARSTDEIHSIILEEDGKLR